MNKWSLFAPTIGVIAFLMYLKHEPTWDGNPAPEEPVQITKTISGWAANAPHITTLEKFQMPKPWSHKGWNINPLAIYRLDAIVLKAQNYKDPAGEISPRDLALAWGPMAKAENAHAIEVKQESRFYEWWAENTPKLTPEIIATNTANVHCIPANDIIAEKLKDVTRNNLIHAEGYLIEAYKTNGPPWKSSLKRTDTGNGACEIFWIEKLEVTEPL